MNRAKVWALAGVTVLLAAACGPAATATPVATVPPTRAAAATATLQAPATAGPTSTPVAVASPTPNKPAASGPRYGGTFRFAGSSMGGGPVPPWDTITTAASKAHDAIGSFVYSRLMRNDSSPASGPPKCAKTYVNDVLDSWRWVDDRTFEVKIKQGIRWHNKPPVNGRELVADDIGYNFVVVAKRPGWGAVGLGQAVDSAEAVDKYTARIRLNQPYALLPLEVSEADRTLLYAKDAVGGDKPQLVNAEQVIGTGPFMLKSAVAGVSVTMERNPNYFEKGLPYLDQVEALLMPDASTRAAVFRSGKVDMLSQEVAITAKQLAKQVPGVQYQSCPELTNWPITFNHSKPPFNDLRVRRAVLMAVDQQVLVDLVYGGEATPTISPMIATWDPFYLKKEDYPPEVRQYLERNTQKAKQLLAEAGYPNGFEVTLHWRRTGLRPMELAETVSGMLNEIGIKGSLREWDTSAFNVHRYAGDLDGMLLAAGGYGLVQLPRTHNREIAGNEYNLQWYRNDRFFELLAKVVQTPMTEQERKAVATELQIIAVRDVIDLPSPNIHAVGLLQPWAKGMYWFGGLSRNNWDWTYKGWIER